MSSTEPATPPDIKASQGEDRSWVEYGQGLVEYGLIIAFVALLAVASLLLFRPSISSQLSNLSASV